MHSYNKTCTLPLSASLLLIGHLILFSSLAMAATPIGKVKTYEPTAKLIRQGEENYVFKGAEIYQGDTLITDSDGAVGIIFDDGSVLTLGPSGKMVFENFKFNPAEKQVSFVSKIVKGTVAFLSGTIGKINPGSIQFKTPTATLGLRGTKILIEVK
jgi:hypothetical protein